MKELEDIEDAEDIIYLIIGICIIAYIFGFFDAEEI